MFNPQTSDLAGIPTPTLQQWLKDAQQAMHDLMTGVKAVTVTYTQGDGQKSVTYNRGDMTMLRGYIQELKMQLGIGRGRRPLRPYFTGNN